MARRTNRLAPNGDTPSWYVSVDREIDQLFQLAIPAWVRNLLVAGIISLFVLYAGLHVYGATTYATKTAVRELKQDLKERMDDGFTRVIVEIRKERE